MSRLRVLICRLDEHDDAQMTELARVDLPPLRPEWGPACLELLEAQVVQAGQRLLARLCELQWEDLDERASSARAVPTAAPGQLVLTLDEVLTRAPGRDQHQELRTACLLSTTRRRYVSGVGLALLRQVHAAVHAC